MAKRRSSKNLRLLFLIVTVIVVVIAAYSILAQLEQDAFQDPATSHSDDTLWVQFIDVGQADSTLVMSSTGETMLIDAGEAASVSAIFEELDEFVIKDIDILVATHPHADHIGGMKSIVERYEIGLVLMPDMPSKSKTYTTLMSIISDAGIPIKEAYAGYRFSFGNAICTVVSPNAEDNKDANNESVVIFLDYGDTDFLFTGDMEKWAENRVLDSNYYIDADVLKVAHHGSSTSSSASFLDAVTPDYAVISCGQNNKYGHPHDDTLESLQDSGAIIYRTDIHGDILFTADGKTLSVTIGD